MSIKGATVLSVLTSNSAIEYVESIHVRSEYRLVIPNLSRKYITMDYLPESGQVIHAKGCSKAQGIVVTYQELMLISTMDKEAALVLLAEMKKEQKSASKQK